MTRPLRAAGSNVANNQNDGEAEEIPDAMRRRSGGAYFLPSSGKGSLIRRPRLLKELLQWVRRLRNGFDTHRDSPKDAVKEERAGPCTALQGFAENHAHDLGSVLGRHR